MTVKELITELLSCPMDAKVSVYVEMDKDFIEKRMEETGEYDDHPICDDVEIDSVECRKTLASILLKDTSEWI